MSDAVYDISTWNEWADIDVSPAVTLAPQVTQDQNALGVDVSRWNGVINWDVAPQHNVIFAGIRRTISWGYRDPFGASNWTGAKRAGVYRIAYHVLYPAESARRQADNLLAAVGGDWENATASIDAELDHGCSPLQITDCVMDLDYILRGEIGREYMPHYSRKGWIDQFTTRGLWRRMFGWLATYNADGLTERPAPPLLPLDVDTWLIHQNAHKMAAFPGFQSGGITTLDRNRWNGTAADVAAFFGGGLQAWARSIDAWARGMGYQGIGPG